MSLIQFAEENKPIILVLKDRVAMWVLGYLLISGPASRQDLAASLGVSEGENLVESIQRLISAALLNEEEGGEYAISERGARLAAKFGVDTSLLRQARTDISCDVFIVRNIRVADASETSKKIVLETLLSKPRLYGPPGERYGFVDCGSLNGDVVFGYFTQEYLAHAIKYDDNAQRQDEWDTANHNVLFVWPLSSNIFVLQDSKFFGASRLNMTETKIRVQMLIHLLCEYSKFEITGDTLLEPYKRVLADEEMQRLLLESKQPVTGTQIELEGAISSIQGRLPVFNPKEDWNDIFTQIINDYELPNISRVIFSAKKLGTLSKSKFVRALALTGKVKRIGFGWGKKSQIVKRVLPTHMGQVSVSEPVTEDDVINILSFLQDQLALRLTNMPLRLSRFTNKPSFDFKLES